MKQFLFCSLFLVIQLFSFAQVTTSEQGIDQKNRFEKFINSHLNELKNYQKQGLKKEQSMCLAELGALYFEMGNYLPALDYHFQALAIAEKMKNKALMMDCYSAIGSVFLVQEDVPKAKTYFLKALKCSKTSSKLQLAKLYNNLGNSYAAEVNNSKATAYYQKALNVYSSLNDKEGIAICTSNLGNIFAAQGDLKKATEFYFDALTLDEAIGSKKGIACDALHIGTFYLQTKNYVEAENQLLRAKAISTELNDLLEQKNVYEQLSALYSQTGRYKEAIVYYQLTLKAKDSLFSEAKKKALTRLEMRIEFEKMEAKSKAKQEKKDLQDQADRTNKKIIAGSLLLIVIALIVAIIFLVQKQQLRRKKDQIIFERETALLTSEKQRLESELDSSKQLLASYTSSMLEKSQLLDTFKNEITNLKALKSKELAEENTDRLDDLNKITIFTADDWFKFQELFEQVHKGFFARLKERLPHLTPAETRLICLTKLQLTTKQMSDVLAVSPDTIKKTRYRLRKKLLESVTEDIDELAKII